MAPEISVIIVNYNVRLLLAQCIDSVLESAGNIDVEVIVVDNNSYDGSVKFINEKYKNDSRIRVIASKINLGFAKANNLGVSHAKGNYLLILNPDTVLREDTLDKCLSFYKNKEGIGALTCRLILPNGKLDLACRRSFPTPSVAVYRILGLSKLFPKSRIFGKYNLTYLDENQTYEVDAIVGAFMFMKKSLFEQIGGFDEDYFMYGEDLDICYRIKKAGYKIYYYPETSIIHYKGESTKKSSISYVSNFYGAMQIFVRKNLKTRFVLMDLLIKLSIFYRSLISYIKRFFVNFYQPVLDCILIVAAMIIAIHQRFESIPLHAYSLVIVVYTLVWLISLSFSGVYFRRYHLSVSRTLMGILIGFFINSSFTYFFKEYAFSRVVVLRTTFNSFLLLAFWRIVGKLIDYRKNRSIFKNTKTLILGKNRNTEHFVDKVKMRIDSEYDIIGYISVNGNNNQDDYIGNLNNLSDIIKAEQVKNIIFAKGELTNQMMLDIMWNLRNSDLSFKILSDDIDILMAKTSLDKIDDIYLMQIEYNINRKFNIFTKRIFDIILGLILLFTAYPVVVLLNLLQKDSKSKRRFTGKFLLIPEVIKGNISIVGRPIWDTDDNSLHLGKKGITGLVQINYYKRLSAREIEYYNYYYAKNQSILLDIEIILRTISLIIFGKIY